MWKKFVTVSFVCALAGCGGGSEDPNAFAFEDPNDAIAASFGLLVAIGGETETPFVDLPPSGTVNYQGLAGVSLEDGPVEDTFVGTFDLDANFATNTIAGSASDFVAIEQTGMGFDVVATGDVGGSLSISNGQILDNAGDAVFMADVTGDLQDGDRTVGISTMLDGEFFGPGAEYVTAESPMGATAQVVSTSSGASTPSLEVSLFGEAQ